MASDETITGAEQSSAEEIGGVLERRGAALKENMAVVLTVALTVNDFFSQYASEEVGEGGQDRMQLEIDLENLYEWTLRDGLDKDALLKARVFFSSLAEELEPHVTLSIMQAQTSGEQIPAEVSLAQSLMALPIHQGRLGEIIGRLRIALSGIRLHSKRPDVWSGIGRILHDLMMEYGPRRHAIDSILQTASLVATYYARCGQTERSRQI